MLELNFDMAQTIAFAVVLLLIGRVIKKYNSQHLVLEIISYCLK